MIIGFFCPALFWLTFGIGFLFEILECLYANCHDAMDLVYNSLGFGLGKLLNQFYFNKKNLKHVPMIWLGVSAALLFIVINGTVIAQ
jgi:glycopeptide antibiotics resistance protein